MQDAGVADGGLSDAGVTDGGLWDAGITDAGLSDAGLTDAGPPAGGACSAAKSRCNNCIDDDSDGPLDGNDPHCMGAIDNDESSFGSGIVGDNTDAVNQDCFFDGNSTSTDDGCLQATCCILGYTSGQCADAGLGDAFDPATDCPAASAACVTNCQPFVPAGCDCYGCCTLCDSVNCVDVEISPAVSPACNLTNLHDPAKCLTCTKDPSCGQPCGGANCVLCPGQDPSMLPGNCNGTTACPAGETACSTSAPCPDTQYCSAGCCIASH